MRDRRHVTDRGDGETDRLQRAQCTFAARTRSLHFDLQSTNTMLLRLAACVFGSDLGGIGRRLAASLEAHHAGGRPADRIALGIGDGDHGVVKRRIHMRHTGGDILTFPATNALRFTSHWKFLIQKLFSASE